MKRGYSQSEVAAVLGIPQELLNDIEHGRLDAPVCLKCQERRNVEVHSDGIAIETNICEWCLVPFVIVDKRNLS